MMDTTRCSDAESASPTAPSVAVGQIWRELLYPDTPPEQQRHLRVERVAGETAFIRTVTRGDNGQWIYPKRSPTREVQSKRFNGQRGGYAFVEAAPQPERVSPGSAPSTDAPGQNTADPEGSA